MTLQRFLPQGGGGRIPPTPIKPTVVIKKSTIGTNPGLLTSTGGLLGNTGLLLTPTFSPITGVGYLIVHNPNNFDCEESAEYDFRQEANYGEFPGEGREASFHLIILKYRELGKANFSINITVFKEALDDFQTIQIPVSIPNIPFAKMSNKRKAFFPDGRIHTFTIAPPKGVITGESPQVSITRNANSGPLSIVKVILCGNADEEAER